MLFKLNSLGPEPNVLFRQEPFQVLVDAYPYALGMGNDPIPSRHTISDMDCIGQQVK